MKTKHKWILNSYIEKWEINTELLIEVRDIKLTVISFKEKIERIIDLIEGHSLETKSHIDRVWDLFASWMEEYNKKPIVRNKKMNNVISSCSSELLRIASWWHDIWKLFIKEEILHKTWKLDLKEWREIENHPQNWSYLIYEIFNESEHQWLVTNEDYKFYEILYNITLHHHKTKSNWYPITIGIEWITFYSEFLRLCDIYDALRWPRSYKDWLSRNETLKIIYWLEHSMKYPEIFMFFLKMEDLFDKKYSN